MEVTIFVVHHHASLSPVLPRSFLSKPSVSPSTSTSRRAKKSQLSFATSTTTTSLVNKPNKELLNNGEVTAKKPHSKFYLLRQSAIRQVQQSTDLGSALSRLEGILKVQDLNAILRHFGTQKRWKELSQLFEWMQHSGKTNAASYSSYIKFMGKSLNLGKTLEIYNNIQDEPTKKNVFICNSVLRSLVQNGKFESSIKLFNQMKQDGFTPDVITYSTLLAGCIKVKHSYSKAVELVHELQHSGLRIDSILYGTLIAICASNNKCEEAENYFKQMRDEGHSPNVFHYSSLLNAYSMDGDYEKADNLVQEMKSAGLVPNKVISTTLLKVYVRAGMFDKSRELLADLEASGFAENEIPYCLLMDALAKAGHIDEAKKVFNEMKKKCVTTGMYLAENEAKREFLDGYSYSIMISAFCRDGQFEDAKQLAKDFESTYGRYDLVMSNTMLCAYCRAEDMESVMKMLKKMDELAISPDYNTFHILIKYFCKERLYLLAYKTMEDMHNKGHQVEEDLCSSLIFNLGKMNAHSEAFTVYKMLRYSKRTMCKALHEKILHILIAGRLLKEAYVVVKDNGKLISKPAIKKFATIFMKSGNINLINEIFKVIHGFGCKIDQDLFTMATSRYVAQPDKKELFLQLLQWMPGHGYAVDSSTRNLILKNSHLFGRQLIAETLSKQQMMLQARKPMKSKG